MITIVVDTAIGADIGSDLVKRLETCGFDAATWSPGEALPIAGVHAVVTNEHGIADVRGVLSDGSVRVIVMAASPSPTTTRHLLRTGADAVVDEEQIRMFSDVSVLAAAAAGFCVIPEHHGRILASRLEEPPQEIQADEERFLALVSTRTIEDAGAAVGYSRRQSQRRFQTLCYKLGFSSHRDASVAAARWGLVEDSDPSPSEH